MGGFRNWLYRFMYGRNGTDQLTRFLVIIAIIFFVISMFVRQPVAHMVIYYIGLIVMIYCLFRQFSRNLAKRQAENRRYLNFRYKLQQKWKKFNTRRKQKKYYRFYDCPNCNVTNRVPKGKGKIIITCPRCGTQFERKS